MPPAWPALAVSSILLAGCFSPMTPATPTGTTPVPTTPPGPEKLTFSGENALGLAREQVLRGDGTVRYRVPGTSGNDEAATLIAQHLREAGWQASFAPFNATYNCDTVHMHNVVGTLAGTGNRTMLLGAHYDTRPIAESDADPANRTKPIQGANDGASGVGVLLDLARAMSAHKRLATTLVMVFFDGEDGGDVGGPSESCTKWLLGSTAFAKAMTAAEVARAKGFVLVDLVGDPGMRLPREGYSAQAANRPLGDRIWAIGNGLGYGARFVNETGLTITDDHAPFMQRGIPVSDLIDLPKSSVFPATHHTQQDDVDHISAAPMEAVGRTLEAFLLQVDGFV